jgi:hypothetical protein
MQPSNWAEAAAAIWNYAIFEEKECALQSMLWQLKLLSENGTNHSGSLLIGQRKSHGST